MALVTQQFTQAGPVLVMDVVQFAAELVDRYPHVLDALAGFAIEKEIFGVKSKKSKRKRKKEPRWVVTAQKDTMFQDYGSAVFSDPNNPGVYFSEDSHYVQHSFPMEDVGDDVIGCIVKQLIEMIVPYPNNDIKSVEEAAEIASCNALENFISPTHVVKIKPKLFVAFDIEDIKIKIAEIDGKMRLSVYTDKLATLKGLEAPNVVEV